MKLRSVFLWQACSCLDGVTAVRPGAVWEACLTASRGCSPVLALSLVPGDCGGGHDHNCIFGPFSA